MQNDHPVKGLLHSDALNECSLTSSANATVATQTAKMRLNVFQLNRISSKKGTELNISPLSQSNPGGSDYSTKYFQPLMFTNLSHSNNFNGQRYSPIACY